MNVKQFVLFGAGIVAAADTFAYATVTHVDMTKQAVAGQLLAELGRSSKDIMLPK